MYAYTNLVEESESEIQSDYLHQIGINDQTFNDKQRSERFFNDQDQVNNQLAHEIFNSDIKHPPVRPRITKKNVRNIAYEFKQKRQIFDVFKKLVLKKYIYERYAENYFFGLQLKQKRVIFNALYKSMTDSKASKLSKELNLAKNEILKLKVEINKSENKKLVDSLQPKSNKNKVEDDSNKSLSKINSTKQLLLKSTSKTTKLITKRSTNVSSHATISPVKMPKVKSSSKIPQNNSKNDESKTMGNI